MYRSNISILKGRGQRKSVVDQAGQHYGADISLTKRLSTKYYGQLGYSFMESIRDDNNGLGQYNYAFNIPHTISILGSYRPSDKWIFSGKFRSIPGRSTDAFIIHPDVLGNPDNQKYGQEITQVNGARLPDFISLDLRADYNVLTKWGVFSAFVGLVNVSNRLSQRWYDEMDRFVEKVNTLHVCNLEFS